MAQKYNENAAQSSLLPFNTTLFDQVVFTDISCWPWLNKEIENFKIAAENSILRQDYSRPNISEFLVYKNKLRILVLTKVYPQRRFFYSDSGWFYVRISEVIWAPEIPGRAGPVLPEANVKPVR